MSISDPAAQSIEDAINPTKRAKAAQSTRYLAIIAVGGLIGCGVLYTVVFNKPAPAHGSSAAPVSKEDEKHNVATEAVTAPQDLSPDAKNVNLQTQLQQMQQELDQEKQKEAGLEAEKEGLTQQVANTADQANQAGLSRKRQVVDASYQSGYPRQALGGAPANSPNALGAPPLQVSQTPSYMRGKSGGNVFNGGASSSAAEQAAGPGAADATPVRQMKVINFSAPGGEEKEGPSAAGTGGKEAGASAGAKGGKKGDVIEDVNIYDASSYVAPNSYVDAEVINSVDMKTSATGSSDPKPILLRIKGDAQGVGMDGHFLVSHLKGCMVTGAADAELSSEKVYVKLEKITCPAGPGKFMESNVEGYVSFMGKVGVRGRVVSREGDFAAKAFIAGTLQGLGQAENMNVQRTMSGVSTGANGAQTITSTPLTNSQIASAAVGGGLANGSNMLAQYYINKAEQYQPVIEMPNGITVQLVFLSGFRYSYKANDNGK